MFGLFGWIIIIIIIVTKKKPAGILSLFCTVITMNDRNKQHWFYFTSLLDKERGKKFLLFAERTIPLW